MKSIQSCFIKKNTPELRSKLEGLGYNLRRNSMPDADNCICIVQTGLYMTFFDLLGYCPIVDALLCEDESQFLTVATALNAKKNIQQLPVKELAEMASELQPNEELHFKRYVDRDAFGIVRLRLFDADLILVSYYGGGNASLFDASVSGCGVEEICSWIADVTSANADTPVYLIDKSE